MRRHIAGLLIGVASLVACNSDGIVGPGDLDRFNQALARWQARPFANYSYEIRVSCFCPPEVTQWARVSVRGGAVVAVDPVESTPEFPIVNFQYWVPIDSIFDDLYRSMTEPGVDYYLEKIIVSYDAQLGYPTNIEYRAKPNIADGGSIHSLRNVTPIN